MDRRIPPVLLAVACGLGILGQALLVGPVAGLDVPLLAGCILVAAAAVHRRGSRVDRLDLWIPPTAVALAAAPALRVDPSLVAFDIMLAAALVAASAAALAGVGVTLRSAIAVLAIGAGLLEFAVAGAVRLARLAQPWVGTKQLRLGPTARSVLRGAAFAAPLLVVFAALFAAADAVFERAVLTVLDLDIDLGEIPARLVVALAIGWPVAGMLGVAAYGLPAVEARSLGAAVRAPGAGLGERPAMPRLGSVEALVVLVAVDLLFAAFVIVQVAYLFGGRDTLAASGLTYSDYARRGFFELVGVAALAGTLLAGLRAVVERADRRFLAASLTLLGLTAVVVLSAALRLRLYQEAYGWTELRFHVAVAIGWLVAALGATAVLLVRDRMDRLPHALAGLVVVATVAITLVGPRSFVADRNVERLLDPSLIGEGGHPGFDLDYLMSLGDEAVPALVRAVGHVPVDQRASLRAHLVARRATLTEDPALTDWRAWNLARDRARAALATLSD